MTEMLHLLTLTEYSKGHVVPKTKPVHMPHQALHTKNHHQAPHPQILTRSRSRLQQTITACAQEGEHE